MSGGVDSSVAAARLLEDGHEVVGVTLRLWGGQTDSGCCSVADVEDARRVAAQLGIDHYVFNMADEFEAEVVRPYVDAYSKGRTPNPCVDCNRTMKFGRLMERATALGFDAVATGHHARLEEDTAGRRWIVRGRDAAKDQSYVLAFTGAPELSRLLLPIGDMTKADVRAAAAQLGLRTAHKAESMDVCFVARRDRAEFVEERAGARPGSMVDVDGNVVGVHDGVARFTIGQRRGVGVAAGERRYVVDVDAPTATVTIGRIEDLRRGRIPIDGTRFTHEPMVDGSRLLVQWRAHADAAGARLGEGELVLDAPAPRVAPGQVVAMYDPDRPDRVVGAAIAAA
jgi:tRNA-specific 2-thiouridylase